MALLPRCILICLGILFITTTLAAVAPNSHDNDIGRAINAKDFVTSLAGTLTRGFTGGTASGASQVVSLNLTNLLVLVLLKALIFAAGSLGAGAWKGGYGRSNHGDEELFSQEELMLFLSYVTGSQDDRECFKQMACRQPEQAQKYYAAGDLLLRVWKMFAEEPDASHQRVLKDLEEAVDVGMRTRDCEARFRCLKENVVGF